MLNTNLRWELTLLKKFVRLFVTIMIITFLLSCKKREDESAGILIDNPDSSYLTLSILEIEDDYFLAELPWPSPRQYKVYEQIEDDYCIGDIVDVEYDEITEIIENKQYEVTVKSIKASDFELQPGLAYKPVIYLYPTEKLKVSVNLELKGNLTKSYPTYSNGWKITASPEGILIDDQGIQYPYLFWEGECEFQYDMSKGFCVSGAETETFLRDKLSLMGLNEKELKDFTQFWVPFLEKNPYNKISFQTKCYTDNAKLSITPEPDSILRIYMVFQPLDEYIQVEEQALSEFDREGFTVIEWGGGILL